MRQRELAEEESVKSNGKRMKDLFHDIHLGAWWDNPPRSLKHAKRILKSSFEELSEREWVAEAHSKPTLSQYVIRVRQASDRDFLLGLPQLARKLVISARLNTSMCTYRANVNGDMLQKCRLCHAITDTQDRWEHVFNNCEVMRNERDKFGSMTADVAFDEVFDESINREAPVVSALQTLHRLLQSLPERVHSTTIHAR